ncbi:MAG TPA: hypothetical protein VHJ18_22880 [Streptosporangiaceae bacterium]|nr:hypothetical protein [Streptosporangiaceae bacterium]
MPCWGCAAITGDLFGVFALTPTDALAVGNQGRTLIVHWNGRTWSRVPSPSPGVAVLEAVSVRSASDAWAVGFYSREISSPGKRSLILHWNGSAWSVARSGVLGRGGSQLAAVTAVSKDDAWAVGRYCPTRCFNQEVKR